MMINVMLLVLGCLVDMAPSILISTPILLPVMVNFGVDPVHFGMIMLLNLGIGLCHPPVGAILFVGCAVGKVTIEQVHAADLAVLRRDVRGADAGDLPAGDLAVAAAPARIVTSTARISRRATATRPARSRPHRPASSGATTSGTTGTARR